jgi:NAD(P)-dependent dehydrogenase (short-subunit alcohol dehydrogenase family)
VSVSGKQRPAERPAGAVSLAGKVAVVTGGAQGIGRALVDELVREQAQGVVVFDRDVSALDPRPGGPSAPRWRIIACQGDVRLPDDLARLVILAESESESEFGRIDILCSNAGVMTEGGAEVPARTGSAPGKST